MLQNFELIPESDRETLSAPIRSTGVVTHQQRNVPRRETSILKKLGFPKELGHCHGTPLVFFDTNVLFDAEDLVKQIFRKQQPGTEIAWGVICDFIEGEAKNLRKGLRVLDELKNPEYLGYYLETGYYSRERSMHSLKDMPTGEMVEAVLVEYDKKLDPSGMHATTNNAKSAARSKSKFGDFSLLTVATIAAFRRKRQSVIVSRDRWIKLSCKALQEKFRLPLYCYEPWNFSVQEIIERANRG